MQAVDSGLLLPGDLCEVLSWPEVPCCIVIEPRERRPTIYYSSFGPVRVPRRKFRTGDWTDTALCTTTRGTEERHGICSHRWRPAAACTSKYFQRIGGRPTTARKGQIPSQQEPPHRPRAHNYRPKIICCRANATASLAGQTAARRRWCGPAAATRSFTAIRQKMLG